MYKFIFESPEGDESNYQFVSQCWEIDKDEIPTCGQEVTCELVNNLLNSSEIKDHSSEDIMKGITYRSKIMSELEKEITFLILEYTYKLERLNKELEDLRSLNKEDIDKLYGKES